MDIKPDLIQCVSLHVTVTGSWYEDMLGALAPPPQEQGWLPLAVRGRPYWGQGLSGVGRQTPHHLHGPGLESQVHLALSRQQHWDQQFSNLMSRQLVKYADYKGPLTPMRS